MDIRKYHFKLFLSIFLFLSVVSTFGQPGNLDLTFNGTGVAFEPNGTINEFAYASAIQPDGKLLVAGNGNIRFTNQDGFVIRRYNTNGLPDPGFGSAGRLYLDFGEVQEVVYSLVVLQDGKILLGGVVGNSVTNNRKGILVRLNTDGSIDNGFGSNGRIITNYNYGAGGNESVNQVRSLPGGKIIVSGFRGMDALLAKYHANGQLDLSFGNAGISILHIYQPGNPQGIGSFDVQPDGRIVVSGQNTVAGIRQFELSRYLPDGQPDSSLNLTGRLQTFIDNFGAAGTHVAVQIDGKIIMLGAVTRTHGFLNGNVGADFVAVRYSGNGLVDSSFGMNGKVFLHFYENDRPNSIAVQADGKILLSGTTYHFQDQGGVYVLARLLSTGVPDSSFATNGKRIYYSAHTNEAWGAGMQIKDQRVYLAGFANGVNNTGTAFNTFAIQNNVGPAVPVTKDLCPSVASTSLNAGLSGSTYQWQESVDGVSFVSMVNNVNQAGVATSILSLNNIPSSWYGRQYRCMVDNTAANVYSIRFINTWTGAQSSAWENPANWSCTTLPDASTAVVISSGTVIINSNVTVRKLTVNPGATLAVNAGFSLIVTN